MQKHNAANERIKRKYYIWLKEARGHSEATIDQVASSIDRFDGHYCEGVQAISRANT
jgi:hypothetical protein